MDEVRSYGALVLLSQHFTIFRKQDSLPPAVLKDLVNRISAQRSRLKRGRLILCPVDRFLVSVSSGEGICTNNSGTISAGKILQIDSRILRCDAGPPYVPPL